MIKSVLKKHTRRTLFCLTIFLSARLSLSFIYLHYCRTAAQLPLMLTLSDEARVAHIAKSTRTVVDYRAKGYTMLCVTAAGTKVAENTNNITKSIY